MMIKREIKNRIIDKLKNSNKIVALFGARQVGKTTLSKEIVKELNFKTLYINADQEKYNDILSSRDAQKIKSLISGYELVFIDEAQRIPDIGVNLKIIHDEFPNIKIIATGSSSFELANKIVEPLTGRIWEFNLYPISILELKQHYSDFEINEKIEDILVFGLYPEVFTISNLREKEELISMISKSYLYKDVLELETIKHADKIKKLLQLLSFQIGSEVSIFELANNLEINKGTVDRYIDLLEKSFVIFRLGGFNRNLRKEVSKMDKIYFYDLGIRNAVIDNFKGINKRNDIGQLWENFLMIERKKYLSYKKINASSYYWRTTTGAELDYIEERRGDVQGFEFKYKKNKGKISKSWLENYGGKYKLINKDNYLKFIS
ncbi:MAG: ATP-binding protein [Patescibacteria group bacterium]|nr:ATP-binding protein [Patescibacteria group bacterium]